MGRIASEALIERLADWGVDPVFGLPGDGINGIMEGLRRHQDQVRFVLVHHEEAAAFMATAGGGGRSGTRTRLPRSSPTGSPVAPRSRPAISAGRGSTSPNCSPGCSVRIPATGSTGPEHWRPGHKRATKPPWWLSWRAVAAEPGACHV